MANGANYQIKCRKIKLQFFWRLRLTRIFEFVFHCVRYLLFAMKLKLSGFKVYTELIVPFLLTQREIVGPNSNFKHPDARIVRVYPVSEVA